MCGHYQLLGRGKISCFLQFDPIREIANISENQKKLHKNITQFRAQHFVVLISQFAC